MIRVYTYKEGLLSRVAHDLQLSLTRFEITLEQGALRGEFDLASLRVDGAVVRGRLVAGALSDGDKARITRNMRDDVLHLQRHPQARFEGRLTELAPSRYRAEGTLELAGRRAPLELELTRGEHIRGSLEFAPSRWGIAPFRALGGALRLQDHVRVELDLPASQLPTGEALPDARFAEGH